MTPKKSCRQFACLGDLNFRTLFAIFKNLGGVKCLVKLSS